MQVHAVIMVVVELILVAVDHHLTIIRTEVHQVIVLVPVVQHLLVVEVLTTAV